MQYEYELFFDIQKRVVAMMRSATGAGGDRHPIVFDVLSNALFDVAHNRNLEQLNVPVSEGNTIYTTASHTTTSRTTTYLYYEYQCNGLQYQYCTCYMCYMYYYHYHYHFHHHYYYEPQLHVILILHHSYYYSGGHHCPFPRAQRNSFHHRRVGVGVQ